MFENEELHQPESEELIPQPVAEAEEQAAEPAAEPAEPETPKKNWKKILLKDLRDLAVILSVFMLIYVLFFRAVVVVGDSMNDTLVSGDRLLLISRTLYRNPEQGDIIVASKDSFKDGEPIIKRVIAVGGQTVDIDFETGHVIVDGVILEETYISSKTEDSERIEFPLDVPEGSVFVLGDNRGNSLDSRSTQIGLIDEREILGKVIFLLFPGSDREHSREFGRIGVVR